MQLDEVFCLATFTIDGLIKSVRIIMMYCENVPLSDDDMPPPSRAMLTFLRATAGKSKGRRLSCCMTGVALLDRSFDEASAPKSCGETWLPVTSVA